MTIRTRAKLLICSLVWPAIALSDPNKPPPTVTAKSSIAVQDIDKDLPVPGWVTVHGDTVVSVKTFDDKNGTNYVVFSKTSTHKSHDNGNWFETGYSLFVDHWVLAKGKEERSLLPARDAIAPCQIITAGFIDSAFTVTDLDKDGFAEVTYGYQLSCRDYGPATYKLLFVENGKKYILRGFSVVAETPFCANNTTGQCQIDREQSGTFVADPIEAKWPDGFYKRAVEVWNATSRERAP